MGVNEGEDVSHVWWVVVPLVVGLGSLLVDARGVRDGAVAWTASFRVEQG